ncbi:MAG: recombinase family protein, partial [Planctomycetes bacterium]|nr:recombinase family protein [Planctomycetota bacterium]
MIAKQISKKLTAKIKAVGYIRMSSGKQEESPEQQRMEIEKLAEKLGYELVRIYFDEGRSGASDHHKRTEFNRMIDDAENTNDFSVILVREQNRFSRMDMLDFFYCMRRLRNAGVKLISTKGEIKADDFVDIVTSGVEQDAARKYSINLSQEVLRGYGVSAENKRLCIPQIPYGYYKQVFDENGKLIFTLKRSDSLHVQKKWTATLSIGDPEEVEIIQWIFSEYLDNATGLRRIANILNERGVPSPHFHRSHVTGKWSGTSIYMILK